MKRARNAYSKGEKILETSFFSERYSGKGISWIKSYFNIRTVVCMTQNHDSWQMVPIAILPKINGHYGMTCSFPRTWSHAMNESDLYFHLWLPLQMYSKTYISRIKIIIQTEFWFQTKISFFLDLNKFLMLKIAFLQNRISESHGEQHSI